MLWTKENYLKKSIAIVVFLYSIITLISCETLPLFSKTAEKVLPSVVHIMIIDKKNQLTPKGWEYNYNPFAPTTENYFEEKKEYLDEGLGSGVIIKQEGANYYVVTNRHVVEGADTITVKLFNGDFIQASLIGFDERKDIAVIAFTYEKPGLKIITLGNSDNLKVGAWVLAVGSPFGFDLSVTSGIISALGRRNNTGGNISDFIQTDASINTGNSGGALVDTRGKLVGINSWITTTTGGSMGLAFAIPVNNIKKSIDDIIKYGEVRYGWMGIIAGEIADFEKPIFLGFENEKGIIILNTILGGPAERDGFFPGDCILSINGKSVEDVGDLLFTIGESEAGRTVEVVISRFGKVITKKITLDLREKNNQLSESKSILWPGIRIISVDKSLITAELSENLDGGVIVLQVEESGIFNTMQIGDIITHFNDTKINNSADFYNALSNLEKKYQITYYRNKIKYQTDFNYGE